MSEESNRPELRFHYDRDERLKKLKRTYTPRKRKPLFSIKKRGRRFIVLLVDLLLVYLIVYFLLKPSNIYLRESGEGVSYELNVTPLKGKKALIGFTLKNEKWENLQFTEPVTISLNIRDRRGKERIYQKLIERDTLLLPGESASLVFLFEENELPRAADLKLFYGASAEPLFSRNVRF